MTDFRLADLFDAPRPAPEPARPFLAHLAPYVTGETPAPLAGRPSADLVMRLTGLTRPEAETLVAFGAFWLADRPVLDSRRKLAAGESFRLNPPAYGPVVFYEASAERIVFEDEDLLVYNKEAGRPSQAVPHDAHNNVLAALTRLLQARDGRGRLWITHRLDADTSGLLLLAKTAQAAGRLGRAFQEGRVEKRYLAAASGPQIPPAAFECRAAIAKEGRRYVARPQGPGLAAHTRFETLALDPAGRLLFRARPLTGRTHQIRLHLAWLGWPVLGDRFYGREAAPRLMLKSAFLAFSHPCSGRRLEVMVGV